jgi:hypothetical protein
MIGCGLVVVPRINRLMVEYGTSLEAATAVFDELARN